MTLAIEYVPLSSIVGADRNPKAHNIEGIKASLRRLRVVDAIGIIDGRTGKLVGGHGRVEALRSMRDADEKPPAGVDHLMAGGDDPVDWSVPVLTGWESEDDAEAEAAIISLNQHTVSGGWDTAALSAMLDDLAGSFDLDTLGFNLDQLDDLRAQLDETSFKDASEAGGTGARTEPSIDDRLDEYKGKAIRSIILDYPLDDYERVVFNARALRAHRGVESNAELVDALLAEAAATIPEAERAALATEPEPETDGDAAPAEG